jgi:hypothetical protein
MATKKAIMDNTTEMFDNPFKKAVIILLPNVGDRPRQEPTPQNPFLSKWKQAYRPY